MPSIITHGFIGFMLPKFWKSLPKIKLKLLILSIICSILPDADALAFKFHIPYGSLFGHRGFSHSIFFALLISVIIFMIFFIKDKLNRKENIIILVILFLSIFLHSILDAMSDGGLGVAFFSPFISDRYFFSFRPIPVAPIGLKRFFTDWGLRVIISELILIWIPILILFLSNYFYQKRRHSQI